MTPELGVLRKFSVVELEDGWFRPEILSAGIVVDGPVVGTWQEAIGELRRLASEIGSDLPSTAH